MAENKLSRCLVKYPTLSTNVKPGSTSTTWEETFETRFRSQSLARDMLREIENNKTTVWNLKTVHHLVYPLCILELANLETSGRLVSQACSSVLYH